MFRGGPERTGVMPGLGPEGPVGVLWTSDALVPGEFPSSPALADGLLFVTTSHLSDFPGGGALHALDVATGRERWRFDWTGSSMGASPAVVDGIVYAVGNDGRVFALGQVGPGTPAATPNPLSRVGATPACPTARVEQAGAGPPIC